MKLSNAKAGVLLSILFISCCFLSREIIAQDTQIVSYDYLDANDVLRGGTVEVNEVNEPFIWINSSYDVTTLKNNGPTDKRIDLVFLGDGYTEQELEQYAIEVNDIASVFFQELPFNEYALYFNVYRVDVISNESGVDNDPTLGIDKDTALGMAFWADGKTERLLDVLYTDYAKEAVDCSPKFGPVSVRV
jgi:hypothetical protein